MRRLLAAAALTAALLPAAGCTADKADTVPQTPSVAPAPPGASSTVQPADAGRQAAADAALSGNVAAICNQAAKTGGQFAGMFDQDRKLLAAAGSAKDKALAAKAKDKAARDVDNYSFALLDMSKLAADPALKKALAEMSKQVSAVKGDVGKLDDKKLAALAATLDKACGR
jgi:hypothetical protein